jgi:intracellular septation protein
MPHRNGTTGSGSEMSRRPAPKWLKPLVDFGPIVLFFIAFKMFGLMPATAILIGATIIMLAFNYALTRHVALMPLITAIIVAVFGGLTLWLNDERFVKMKPTIIYTMLAFVLFGGIFLKKPTLQYVLGEALKMTDAGWWQLTWRFALFFAAMAILNEIVWRTVSTDTWVNFKVFGAIGLTFLFSICQMPLMKQHMIDEPNSEGR